MSTIKEPRAPVSIARLGQPGLLRVLALLAFVTGVLCVASFAYAYQACRLLQDERCVAPVAGGAACFVVFVLLNGLLSYAPMHPLLPQRTRKVARITIAVIVLLLLLAQMRLSLVSLAAGPLVVLASALAHLVNVVRGDKGAGAAQ